MGRGYIFGDSRSFQATFWAVFGLLSVGRVYTARSHFWQPFSTHRERFRRFSKTACRLRGFVFFRISIDVFKSQSEKPPCAQAITAKHTRMMKKMLRDPSVFNREWRPKPFFGGPGESRGNREWCFRDDSGDFSIKSLGQHLRRARKRPIQAIFGTPRAAREDTFFVTFSSFFRLRR